MLAPILGLPIQVVNSQHAARATTEIAVVEVKTFALEDEGTDAILWWSQRVVSKEAIKNLCLI